MSEQKVAFTGAGEIELPVEDVVLTGKALRRKGGAPLVVRCEFIEEDVLLRAVESTPGHAPTMGVPEKKSLIDTTRGLLKYAPGLITAGCVLVDENGVEQRPAFHFGADPHDGSLPGRFLSTPEKLVLLMTILRLSGYVGGAADSIRFPDRDGTRSDGRAGDLDTGEGDGHSPVDTPVRSGEGEPDAADAGAGSRPDGDESGTSAGAHGTRRRRRSG